jgi:hypothetical protein
VADITYLQTACGWHDLALVVDLFWWENRPHLTDVGFEKVEVFLVRCPNSGGKKAPPWLINRSIGAAAKDHERYDAHDDAEQQCEMPRTKRIELRNGQSELVASKGNYRSQGEE